MEETTSKFESWAIVEIMGHVKLAGMATTQTFGDTVLLRIDVPETDKQPAHTVMYGMKSIYSLKPCDEHTARLHAEVLNVNPITEYDVKLHIEKRVKHEAQMQIDRQLNPPQKANEWRSDENEDEYYDDDDRDDF